MYSHYFSDNQSLDLVASPLGPIRTTHVIISDLDKDILLNRLSIEIIQKFQFTLSPKTIISSSTNTSSSKLSLSTKKSKKRCRNSEIANCSTSTTNISSLIQNVVKQRLITGTNQCTRAIIAYKNQNQSNTRPSLVIACREIRPPTILAHIPFLCQELNIPFMILPGKASNELGTVLGGKRVSILVLMERCESLNRDHDNHESNLTASSGINTKEEEEGNFVSTSDENKNDKSGDMILQSYKREIEDCHERIDSFIAFAKTKLRTPPSSSS